MNYNENAVGVGQAMSGGIANLQGAYADKLMVLRDEEKLTPRINIERQIAHHKAQIAKLEETMNNLSKTSLLDVPILQLRQAMQY